MSENNSQNNGVEIEQDGSIVWGTEDKLDESLTSSSEYNTPDLAQRKRIYKGLVGATRAAAGQQTKDIVYMYKNPSDPEAGLQTEYQNGVVLNKSDRFSLEGEFEYVKTSPWRTILDGFRGGGRSTDPNYHILLGKLNFKDGSSVFMLVGVFTSPQDGYNTVHAVTIIPVKQDGKTVGGYVEFLGPLSPINETRRKVASFYIDDGQDFQKIQNWYNNMLYDGIIEGFKDDERWLNWAKDYYKHLKTN